MRKLIQASVAKFLSETICLFESGLLVTKTVFSPENLDKICDRVLVPHEEKQGKAASNRNSSGNYCYSCKKP